MEKVTELPKDCIQIRQYNGRKYDFLFYCPSENAIYQAPPIEYKKLTITSTGYVTARDNDKNPARISLNALQKYISDTNANCD